MTLAREHLSYQIVVQGHLDASWSDWFDGFTITYPDDDATLLSGALRDQAQLFAAILKIRDLNLRLISVTALGEQK